LRSSAQIDFFFFFPYFMFKGIHTPGFAHSAQMEAEDLFCFPFVVGEARGPRLVSFVQAVMYGGSTYPFGMKDHQKREITNKINCNLVNQTSTSNRTTYFITWGLQIARTNPSGLFQRAGKGTKMGR